MKITPVKGHSMCKGSVSMSLAHVKIQRNGGIKWEKREEERREHGGKMT